MLGRYVVIGTCSVCLCAPSLCSNWHVVVCVCVLSCYFHVLIGMCSVFVCLFAMYVAVCDCVCLVAV